ncbi:MAG TPA: type I phosphomannose isomerase catalytic subunit [Phycisphaerae bacterium]|nr:type I phosphomannose isomerase catalytic subunit [Phycisphaerae bacterium]
MYPLKFRPVFQKRVWGGSRLRAVLGKGAEAGGAGAGPVGESWELADLGAGTVGVDSAGANADGSFSSVIANGKWAGRTLHEFWKSEVSSQKSEVSRGGAGAREEYFPLLVKFLDAGQDLSVQVHPDEAYCGAHAGAHLKSEAWYILDAAPGARIYKGLKAGVTREVFREALERGEVEPVLKAVPVRAGDCHYLRSGTIHALGAGILAAEVQTPSDTTFRVFDWNRLGADGKPRKLHVAEALECIDFSPPPTGATAEGGERSHVASVWTTVTRLVTCEYFTLERVRMVQGYEQALPHEEAVVMIVVEGQGVIHVEGEGPTAFARGETLLLPAGMGGARLKTVTDCAWLEAKAGAE